MPTPCRQLVSRTCLLLFALVGTSLGVRITSRVDADDHFKEVQSEAGSDDYRVLTYNLCWGCMAGSTQDKTMMGWKDLAKRCPQRTERDASDKKAWGKAINVSSCAWYMGAGIGHYSEKAKGYDLIAFQGATKFEDLHLAERGVKLEKKTYAGHSDGSATVVSMYNDRKFGQPVQIEGIASNCSTMKPYLILIFDKKRLMFINIENCPYSHRGSYSWNGFLQEMHHKLADSFREKAARMKYRIILAGDFQDNARLLGHPLASCLKVPWNEDRFNLQTPLPKSCCSGKLNDKMRSTGDYIMDTASQALNYIPASYDVKLPQSYHRPVEAILSTSASVMSSNKKATVYKGICNMMKKVDETVANKSFYLPYDLDGKCEKDTGGSCNSQYKNFCHASRGDSVFCEESVGKCHCKEGFCVFHGKCVQAFKGPQTKTKTTSAKKRSGGYKSPKRKTSREMESGNKKESRSESMTGLSKSRSSAARKQSGSFGGSATNPASGSHFTAGTLAAQLDPDLLADEADQLVAQDEHAELGDSSDDEAGDNETYRVLSYNICWGCMEADTGDSTGMQNDLSKVCMKDADPPVKATGGENGMGLNITQCAANTGEAIREFNEAIGGSGYDLLGFQEASNVGDLYLDRKGMALETVLHSVPISRQTHAKGINIGKTKSSWMASMYNPKRTGMHHVKIGGVLESDNGRPWLILIFDDVKLMFINVHNTHPGRGAQPRESWRGFPDEMSKHQDMEKALKDKPERANYRSIVVGDFNDLKGDIPGCITLPWSQSTLKLQEPLPPTCCPTKKNKEARFYGDYIFDSASTPQIRIPRSYDGEVPKSDHMPVEAVLRSTSNTPSDVYRKSCEWKGKHAGESYKNPGSYRRTSPKGTRRKRR